MLAAAVLLAQLGIVASAPDTISLDGYAEVQVRVTARSPCSGSSERSAVAMSPAMSVSLG